MPGGGIRRAGKPRGVFCHPSRWVPGGLPEGLPQRSTIQAPVRADQGVNSFGRLGYSGPLPPIGHGLHHYVFRIYALRAELALPPGSSRSELARAIEGHVLDAGQLMGTFIRESARRSA